MLYYIIWCVNVCYVLSDLIGCVESSKSYRPWAQSVELTHEKGKWEGVDDNCHHLREGSSTKSREM